MKVLYRPQRGGLDESMEELKEFAAVEDLLNWLCEDSEICGKKMFEVEDINFSYYCYDERIDWQTFIVTINKWGEEDYLEKYHSPQAIGFMTFKYCGKEYEK